MENEIMNSVENEVTTGGSSVKAEGAAAVLTVVGIVALGHLAGEGIKAGYKKGKAWLQNRKKAKAVLEIDNTIEDIPEFTVED